MTATTRTEYAIQGLTTGIDGAADRWEHVVNVNSYEEGVKVLRDNPAMEWRLASRTVTTYTSEWASERARPAKSPKPGEFYYSNKYGTYHEVVSVSPIDGHLTIQGPAGNLWRTMPDRFLANYTLYQEG